MILRFGSTEIEIARGSVTEQDVDAIVNAANTSMQGGGGIDGRIHREAGPDMMAELRRIAPHGAKTGRPVVTEAYRLPQKRVIHVAGPVWNGGARGEAELLAACYASSLQAADDLKLQSIAFCSISTGVYRYPINQAAAIAVRSAANYCADHPGTNLRRIVFALYGADEYAAFLNAAAQITGPD